MTFTSTGDSLLKLNQVNFDFNLRFEQLFLSIIPSAIFIIASSWRVIYQVYKPTLINARFPKLLKLSALAIYLGLELSLLVFAAVRFYRVTSILIASAVLRVLSAICMIALSVAEHHKSPRPSILLCLYVFLTLLFDIVETRTLFLSSDSWSEQTYSIISSTAVAAKVGVLLLEARRKTRWLAWDKAEHSPEETSGVFSLAVFSWLNRVFLDGYNKVLAVEDLFPLDSSLDSQSLHDGFTKHMDYSKLKGDKFGLLKVLVKTLKRPLLLPILPRLALLGFTLCQPFFINTLLDHLSRPYIDANVGYGLIAASILIYSGIGISTAFYWYFHLRMLTMARSILVTDTFSKAVESRIGLQNDNPALTLMSVDIERISIGFRSLHDFWASFIQVAFAAWMIYNQLGAVFLAPIVIVIICVAVLAFLMTYAGDSQKAWMASVQKRVALTATVISNMKNLKASGLSTVIGDYVQNLRVEELANGARFRKIETCAAIIAFTPLMMGPPLTFAFAQRTLDAPRIFTSLSYLLLLSNPLSNIFQMIPGLISGLACLARIQAFLECESRQDFRTIYPGTEEPSEKHTQHSEASLKSESSNTHVDIVNGCFGWDADSFVLQDINTKIPRSSLTMVVGLVASGKTTFCNALLGEIPFSKGRVSYGGTSFRIGFCDQTPFLTNASIWDNIVGFSMFDANRYFEVINVTALQPDIDGLAAGDKTVIGSDGAALSGGQKQRISLSRALYLQTDLLVLDDIFSGLDSGTEDLVFRQVFGPEGLLRRRKTTVVLCTHSIKHLPLADHIVAIGGGSIVEQGTFKDLVNTQGYVQNLRVRISLDSDDISEEAGRLQPEVKIQEHHTTPTGTATELYNEQYRQIGDKAVYKHYFKSMGKVLAACSVLWGACFGFFMNYPTIWLERWSSDAYAERPAHSFAFYAGIYGLLQACAMACLGFLGYSLFILSVKRAGARLHQEALHTLIRAPLTFFTKTDTGIVTNLFSQDLNLIDTELPEALFNTFYAVFTAFGQAIVLVTSSSYMAISYPFLILLMWIVQRFYLRTSRQLRLLDLEAKSPLYTHFLDTLKGIVTLRALGFIADEIKKNRYLINSSQRPAYLLFMIQQWLMLVLDLAVMVLAAVLTALAVKLHTNTGFTGASLVTLMSFGRIMSGIVMFYTKLETSIGAIARLKTFNEKVKPENQAEEDIIPSEEWPEQGVIVLKGISASYSNENDVDGVPELALRDIDLTIGAGEKIAICGRTGSGKSSLLALILKFLEPLRGDGYVLIDGLPLSRIHRPTLRERIIAVPQGTVFLPDGSTFQQNLDPFSAATADDCKEVLQLVGLWSALEDKGGLDAPMEAEHLSHGQRQLMSLGRAILRRRIRSRARGGDGCRGGILLLDEVSSSVDYETEKMMKDAITGEFKDYTVVAISHRLDVIMDFDRVVVMDSGNIVETGDPRVLAEETGTRFGELVMLGLGKQS